jgi:hypothetical protein
MPSMEPDRADRQALLRDLHAARVVQQAQHVQQVGVVERLAHAHEDHVLELPAQHVPGHQQLGHDLVGAQVPEQPHARGLAEGAAHLAAHLAGHTQRVLVAPHGDEHALHLVAVFEAQHGLGGGAGLALFGHRAGHAGQLEAEGCVVVSHGLGREP